jgi:hypothetical protein
MTCEYCQHADEEIVILERDLHAARDENHRLSAENATLRASGRLAPAVEGDVAYHAANALLDTIPYVLPREVADAVIRAVFPIIAAATEARVRDECAQIADDRAYMHQQEGQKSVAGDAYAEGTAEEACNAIASLIRTGATR